MKVVLKRFQKGTVNMPLQWLVYIVEGYNGESFVILNSFIIFLWLGKFCGVTGQPELELVIFSSAHKEDPHQQISLFRIQHLNYLLLLHLLAV
jgi:hypothetical protein